MLAMSAVAVKACHALGVTLGAVARATPEAGFGPRGDLIARGPLNDDHAEALLCHARALAARRPIRCATCRTHRWRRRMSQATSVTAEPNDEAFHSGATRSCSSLGISEPS
jgi:hypothetical protein